KVHDILGREVADLSQGNLPAGRHVFRWNGASRPSGIYFVTVQAGPMKETRKMVLMK
ncbi:T9SS type A sorting domain-containing protein, partial [bacterium]|nr:T9SS type A sorting domain-containing protein [bacterium]